MEGENRTLFNNCIKNFILRIDFNSNNVEDFKRIVTEISAKFSRLESRQHINYTLNLDRDKMTKENMPDFVLINEEKALLLTFSTFNNALIIEISKYIDNKIYKEFMDIVISALKKLKINIESKRIGMRYINQFPCKSIRGISKILNKEKTKIITLMCENEFVSRVIAQEELNDSETKLRVQYGIPNKFYPAIITTFDLLLDIDSYDDSTHSIDDWNETIRDLNHKAYDSFTRFMNTNNLGNYK